MINLEKVFRLPSSVFSCKIIFLLLTCFLVLPTCKNTTAPDETSPSGFLTLEDGETTIPIYREGAVSNADMNQAVLDIQNEYDLLAEGPKIIFATKGVIEIRVVPYPTGSFNNGIITVGISGAENFGMVLSALGLLSLENMKEPIKLAGDLDTTKKNVCIG